MRVIVCLPGNNFSSKFLMSLWDLQDGARRNGIELIPSPAKSCNIYMVRSMCLGADVNRGTKQKPFNSMSYDYVLWIDSDMVFTHKHLAQLLSYKQDIIAAYYSWEGGQGLTCGNWNIEEVKKGLPLHHHTEQSLKASPCKNGLVEVDYTGFGFLLVKHGVFESLDYPWFKPEFTTFQKGEITISDFSFEDVGWCLNIKKKGYHIYVDPTLKAGHEKSKVW